MTPEDKMAEYRARVGGFAFPVPSMGQGGERGMTLRDYFAAAVAGHIWECMDSELDSGTCATGVAQKAYMIADEMLKQRLK